MRGVTVLTALTALALGGCGGSRRSVTDYHPETSLAKRALEASLAASRESAPTSDEPLSVEGLDVKVAFVDRHRKPGQRLASYEILGEVGGDGPKTFLVRLVLSDPDEEIKVRYYVFGIDPLWVMRQEDYDQTTHWDDGGMKMDPEPKEASDPSADAPSKSD